MMPCSKAHKGAGKVGEPACCVGGRGVRVKWPYQEEAVEVRVRDRSPVLTPRPSFSSTMA